MSKRDETSGLMEVESQLHVSDSPKSDKTQSHPYCREELLETNSSSRIFPDDPIFESTLHFPAAAM